MTPGFDEFLTELRTQLVHTAAAAAQERVRPVRRGAARLWNLRPRMAFVAGVLVPAAVVLAIVVTATLTADDLRPSTSASRLTGSQGANPTPAFVLPAQPGVVASPGAQADADRFAYLPAAVAAHSAGDVWAVGSRQVSDELGSRATRASSFILHWDGAIWRETSAPDVGPLSAVVTAANGEAWALSAASGIVLRWDGRQWSAVTSGVPSGAILSDITVAGEHDVWAVGSQLGEPLALHWGGSEWQTTVLPEASGAGAALSAVSASSATNVWAVGSGPGGEGLVFRWDGVSWTAIASSGGSNYSRTVIAISPQDVWTGGAALRRWDGGQWNEVSNALDGFSGTAAVLSPSDIWLRGDDRNSVVHWDGASWRVTTAAEMGVPAGDAAAIQSVTAASSSDVWAVGTVQHAGELTARPLILHWNGFGWRLIVDAAQTYGEE